MGINPRPHGNELDAPKSHFVQEVEWEAGRAPHGTGRAWGWGSGPKSGPAAHRVRAGVGVKVLPGEDKGSDCWQQVAWEKPSPAEGSPNPLSIQPTCYRPEIYGDLKKN